MFTKIIIALSAVATIATTLSPAANAQTSRWYGQPGEVQPFTDAERLWFSIPEGRDHLVR